MTNAPDTLALYTQATQDAIRDTTPGHRFMGAFHARDVRGHAADSPDGRLYVTFYLTALPSGITTDPDGIVIE